MPADHQHLKAGMSDTQMGLGKDRQGHPTSDWQAVDVSEFNLPTLVQMGQETASKREANARLDSELLWHNEMGRLIAHAFQPVSYASAMRALHVIKTRGPPGASAALADLVNPIGIGRHIMYNMQVDHHRDGHNANLFASANFFGQHYGGGHLILNYLGYAVSGAPGYSLHGAFDILMHGVTGITHIPNANAEPPQRICMAIYSHAEVFASAARFSGMQQEPKVFSDGTLWIPFYAKDFSLELALDCLRQEKVRLYEDYRNEVRRYKAAVATKC
ncbi:hypothetical protein DFH28DRAFT_881112 [Melampsora americana]|nr:hypothetical protein DFH28DRAFT_881112 [Melampsora americana]